MAFFVMKIENGLENAENYVQSQPGGRFIPKGEYKNCQTWGWSIQLPAPNSSEGGGDGLFKRTC